MNDDLVDRIYEAAFVPEKWLGAIAELGKISGSVSGSIAVFAPGDAAPDGMPAFRLSDIIRFLAIEPFGEAMRYCRADHPSLPVQRVGRWFARGLGGYQGFIRSADVLSPQELEHDPAQKSLAAVGLEAQAGLTTAMPGGEAAMITLERRADDEWHHDRTIAALNAYGPHLSRASLISTRLGLERAVATVSTLQALGLPAAILRASGAVLATNTLFDDMREVFLPAAFGRLALADQAADALFGKALESIRIRRSGVVRSIPIAARSGAPAVVHVLPLVRSAYDIFSGAEILVVAAPIRPSNFVPEPSLLIGLYDLTPAEARLASALGSGQLLAAAAAANKITVKSARTYLERIFAKTGTHRQGELVALLRSVTPLGAVELAARTH